MPSPHQYSESLFAMSYTASHPREMACRPRKRAGKRGSRYPLREGPEEAFIERSRPSSSRTSVLTIDVNRVIGDARCRGRRERPATEHPPPFWGAPPSGDGLVPPVVLVRERVPRGRWRRIVNWRIERRAGPLVHHGCSLVLEQPLSYSGWRYDGLDGACRARRGGLPSGGDVGE